MLELLHFGCAIYTSAFLHKQALRAIFFAALSNFSILLNDVTNLDQNHGQHFLPFP